MTKTVPCSVCGKETESNPEYRGKRPKCNECLGPPIRRNDFDWFQMCERGIAFDSDWD